MRLRSATKLKPYDLVKTTAAMPVSTQKALEAALKLLRGRDRFEEEIRGACVEIDCTAKATEDAIEYLRGKRFLDDTRLARNEADRLARRKFWPKQRISAYLAQRGANADAIEAALAVLPPEAQTASLWLKKCKGAAGREATKLRAAGFDDETVEGFEPEV